MTNEQWKKLIDVINGELVEPLPVGLILDCAWLPGWAGISTMDYFSSEQMWFESNLKAIHRFPDIMFVPDFWAEFGMCTEPSSFGARSSWSENEPPFAEKLFTDIQGVYSLQKPNPRKDGLTPFVLNRLKHYQSRIEEAGHSIKFATSRGPLNISLFLMDSKEFLMGIRTNPEGIHKLVGIVTDFIIDWLKLQVEIFPSIDGVLILDDIVGFYGEDDFKEIALPYLKRIFQSLDVTVKFFHNDAEGLVCAPYLPEIGVNLFNFSFQHTLEQMKELTNNIVTLFGNIPPLEVLLGGTPEDVRSSVKASLDSVTDKSRIIISAGGGVSPGTPTENIEALQSAAG